MLKFFDFFPQRFQRPTSYNGGITNTLRSAPVDSLPVVHYPMDRYTDLKPTSGPDLRYPSEAESSVLSHARRLMRTRVKEKIEIPEQGG